MGTRRPRKRRRMKRSRRGNFLAIPRNLRSPIVRVNKRTGGFVDIENKFGDFELNASAFATTWAAMNPATADSISPVAQGDGESNRDGRVYHINSIHIRGQVDINVSESQTAPIEDIYVRVLMIHDTQTNAAELTATDVMDGGQTNDWFSFRNLQNTTRFRVIAKFTRTIRPRSMNEGAVNLFAMGKQLIPFAMNHRFKSPMKVICSGTTAVIGSIRDNSLHIIGVASNTAARLSYQSRVRFTG